MTSRRAAMLAAAALVVVTAVALALPLGISPPPGERAATTVAGGDPDSGRGALADYGCTACHSIPGVTGQRTLVGPPLDDWSERGSVAGQLPNEPDALVHWITEPQSVDPGNVMPDMGVPDAVARDMAAYLYTLGR